MRLRIENGIKGKGNMVYACLDAESGLTFNRIERIQERSGRAWPRLCNRVWS